MTPTFKIDKERAVCFPLARSREERKVATVRCVIESTPWQGGPEGLAHVMSSEPGTVLLHSARTMSQYGRYSLVTSGPMITFRSYGSKAVVTTPTRQEVHYGNPWHLMEMLLARFELLDEMDYPFPLGACFGYWGYDLKNFLEPKLSRSTVDDLELPDSHLGFYSSLVVFDHELNQAWIIATGFSQDGSRTEKCAREHARFWRIMMSGSNAADRDREFAIEPQAAPPQLGMDQLTSSMSRDQFLNAVHRAKNYIREGHIYQVNLAQRLTWPHRLEPWNLYQRLANRSPAPFSAFLNCDDFSLVSSSPELFLRLSGTHILTRPIKGTRPRSEDSVRDAQLGYELQNSPKENAELVMITDLLRNDLGRVCEFGSVQVPQLVCLEKFAQVQHLVSTVEGRILPKLTHLDVLSTCFPGGSITGAPKIRAMQIIEELEPVTRGPYTGSIGYLGFNRESQLNITIRTAICSPNAVHYHVGAGIVADSIPEAEYDETLAKAAGFLAALSIRNPSPKNAGTGTNPAE